MTKNLSRKPMYLIGCPVWILAVSQKLRLKLNPSLRLMHPTGSLV